MNQMVVFHDSSFYSYCLLFFVGSCSVAAMNCNRNCLALECDPLLFIQSKVRLTSLTSKSSNMEAEVDEEIVDQQQ